MPTVELIVSPEEGLIFGVVSAADSTPQQQPQTQPTPQPVEPRSETQRNEPALLGAEEIEVVVTGERETEGYSVPNASTATKTDTPLPDIPQSIQVVPRQLIEDRQLTSIPEALQTVPGVISIASTPNVASLFFNIRGFTNTRYRNGFRNFDADSATYDIANIEQIEVLKGPASVLYGQAEPGGLINVVSKKPLFNPYSSLTMTFDNGFPIVPESFDLPISRFLCEPDFDRTIADSWRVS